MATDITRTAAGVVTVTDGANQKKVYVAGRVIYSFNAAGTILNVNFGNVDSYSIPFANITVGGVAPADVAATYTALATVFTQV